MRHRFESLHMPQVNRSLPEEPFPERFADLTKIERLGLDENTYPLTMHGQQELFPKAIAWLYGFGYSGNTKLTEIIEHRFNDAFHAFDLNLDLYDQQSNPQGMLLRKPRSYNEHIYMKNMTLRMLGMQQRHILNEFFGYQVDDNFTPTFKAKQEIQDKERDSFLITNKEEYPRINEMLNRLERMYNVKPENIFVHGKTPTLKLTGRDTFTMQQYLRYLLDILSGSYTAKELLRKSDTEGMAWGHIKNRVTQVVQDIVEEKRKRDR